MAELLIKMPFRRNTKTGNVSLNHKQWNELLEGNYDRLKVVLQRDETVVINTEIHNWMVAHVRHYDDYIVMPYSKGSTLVRYAGK